MLPGTLIYVNAGTRLADIDSLAAIVSPTLLLSFTLLGVFPGWPILGFVSLRSDATIVAGGGRATLSVIWWSLAPEPPVWSAPISPRPSAPRSP
ncbi:hypothetical protein O0544_22345 [Edwardsiella anguillarum]|nr:hypothetical protein [Edwardsiella anguillarum]